jgi:hypothetical protein
MQTSIYDTSPEHFDFGGGSHDSVIHPAVAVALAVVIVLFLIRPRKSLLAPLFLFVFLVPSGQQIYLGGIHLYCIRILILVGCLRLLWTKFSQRGDVLAGGFNAVDGVFTTWALYRALAGILLFMQSGAVINQIGFVWDVLGMYFLLRFLIRDREDIERTLKVFAVIAVVIAAEMVREHYTAQNLFATILGGVQARLEVRNGLLRAQAVFQHALMAGTFGAVLFPLFVLLWRSGHARILAALGMVSSLAITLASSVSTPIMAFAAGIAAICAWPVRGYLRIFRYVVVIALVGLHIVMKAPVWFLIARIDIVGGSTSYQRAQLIDLFLRHVGDWWLIGTNQNANWGWDMWDTTNMYVTEGEKGGLVAFFCFIALIWLSYRHLGKARKAEGVDRNTQWFLWLLGAALFSYCVAFIGVNLFDQSRFAWYALLAMISAATAPILAAKAPVEEPLNVNLGDSRPAPAFPAAGRQAARTFPYEPSPRFKPRPSYTRKMDES